MIDGIEVVVDREAIVNLHVRKNIPEAGTDGLLPRFADRRGIRGPWVGQLTSAWTEKAVVAEAIGSGLTALVVVTVGLSNRITAGQTPLGAWAPSTINSIVVVAATGHGPRCRFGGPISDFGWVVARAAHEALDTGIRRWMEEHP